MACLQINVAASLRLQCLPVLQYSLFPFHANIFLGEQEDFQNEKKASSLKAFLFKKGQTTAWGNP
jgi:hypothetical protein